MYKTKINKLINNLCLLLVVFIFFANYGQANDSCLAEFIVGEGIEIEDYFKPQKSVKCEVGCGVGCYVGVAGRNLVDLDNSGTEIKEKMSINYYVGNWKTFTRMMYVDSESELHKELDFYLDIYNKFNNGLNPTITKSEILGIIKSHPNWNDALALLRITQRNHEQRKKLRDTLAQIEESLNLEGITAIGWLKLLNLKWYHFLYSTYTQLIEKNKCKSISIQFSCMWFTNEEESSIKNQDKWENRKKYASTPIKYPKKTFQFEAQPIPNVFNNKGFKDFMIKMSPDDKLPTNFNCGDRRTFQYP